MTYCGPNSEAVEEVLDLVKAGRVLVPVAVLGPVRRESSLERAKHLAWEEAYGAEGYTWTDIREREMAAVKKDAYETDGIDGIRDALSKQEKSLLLLLKRRLEDARADLLDDVFADLSNCALKRALHGRQPGFFEDLFEVYQSGGWPCGWEGDYPKGGSLVAYYPEQPHNNPTEV